MSRGGPPVDKSKWVWKVDAYQGPTSREICASMSSGLFVIRLDSQINSNQTISFNVSSGMKIAFDFVLHTVTRGISTITSEIGSLQGPRDKFIYYRIPIICENIILLTHLTR